MFIKGFKICLHRGGFSKFDLPAPTPVGLQVYSITVKLKNQLNREKLIVIKNNNYLSMYVNYLRASSPGGYKFMNTLQRVFVKKL